MVNNDKEDLTKVKVTVVTCTKCDGVILTCVNKYISKNTTKEISKLMLLGCDVKTTNVVVARTLRWCWEEKSNCEGMFPKKEKKK